MDKKGWGFSICTPDACGGRPDLERYHAHKKNHARPRKQTPFRRFDRELYRYQITIT